MLRFTGSVSLQKDPRHWLMVGGGIPRRVLQRSTVQLEGVPQHHLHPKLARLLLCAASENIYL